ncbi:MAG: enoyl-CoA hydratase/isomerase family protein, partial [Deltaproteobacteria bacterium]|nr:enoyl-CoA hydratase/isomerase family protein [Deltaproteobacteria bacterium]
MRTEYETIKVEFREGVLLMRIDNPPVNQMSPKMWEDFSTAMMEAFEEGTVEAIVLTGTGKNFIAGADITYLKGMKDRDKIYSNALLAAQFLSGIETGPKPVVAAINGNALGGGLETAIVCHYRVAVKGASLGQPEVQIGLIPGAGGTQRLP